jgi:hypothetical protein
VKRGKTPVLSPEEARRVLYAIDVSTHTGLRDRAPDRPHGFFVRAHRCGARHEGRGQQELRRLLVQLIEECAELQKWTPNRD